MCISVRAPSESTSYLCIILCKCVFVYGRGTRRRGASNELSGFVRKGPALFRPGSQCSRIALAGVYRLVAVCAARACVLFVVVECA